MAMLDDVKLLLGRTDTAKDSLITLLINQVNDEVKAYCNITEIPDGLNNTITQIVVTRYNRLGTEGLASQNFNGASESYTDSYSPSILSVLRQYRKVKLL